LFVVGNALEEDVVIFEEAGAGSLSQG